MAQLTISVQQSRWNRARFAISSLAHHHLLFVTVGFSFSVGIRFVVRESRCSTITPGGTRRRKRGSVDGPRRQGWVGDELQQLVGLLPQNFGRAAKRMRLQGALASANGSTS